MKKELRDARAQTVLDSLHLSEHLKKELRHSWISNGRQESVAEHSWQMAFLAMLCHPYLEKKVDLEHSLKMILIHDLVEAETGDIPFFEKSERRLRKKETENSAMKKIASILPEAAGRLIPDLWEEFEANQTIEAKFVHALDHLEVQIQHNLADFRTWETIEYDLVYTKMDKHCAHDEFLIQLCNSVKDDAEAKLLQQGIDVEEIKRRIATTQSK